MPFSQKGQVCCWFILLTLLLLFLFLGAPEDTSEVFECVYVSLSELADVVEESVVCSHRGLEEELPVGFLSAVLAVVLSEDVPEQLVDLPVHACEGLSEVGNGPEECPESLAFGVLVHDDGVLCGLCLGVGVVVSHCYASCESCERVCGGLLPEVFDAVCEFNQLVCDHVADIVRIPVLKDVHGHEDGSEQDAVCDFEL